jgi:hypothetical protein
LFFYDSHILRRFEFFEVLAVQIVPCAVASSYYFLYKLVANNVAAECLNMMYDITSSQNVQYAPDVKSTNLKQFVVNSIQVVKLFVGYVSTAVLQK